jgi:hypothetical protein
MLTKESQEFVLELLNDADHLFDLTKMTLQSYNQYQGPVLEVFKDALKEDKVKFEYVVNMFYTLDTNMLVNRYHGNKQVINAIAETATLNDSNITRYVFNILSDNQGTQKGIYIAEEISDAIIAGKDVEETIKSYFK